MIWAQIQFNYRMDVWNGRAYNGSTCVAAFSDKEKGKVIQWARKNGYHYEGD